jgi:type I restriction enzyme R subunit/putative DNA methylase
MDRALDEASFGPSWLRREELAQTVVEALRYAADKLRYFDLHAFAVMPNHVHVLLLPLVDPSKLLQSVKGFSAREANKRLSRTGEPFWQGESYDHWVRNKAEFERIRRYIEENAVRAGLAARAEDYPWSSAYAGANAGMAG